VAVTTAAVTAVLALGGCSGGPSARAARSGTSVPSSVTTAESNLPATPTTQLSTTQLPTTQLSTIPAVSQPVGTQPTTARSDRCHTSQLAATDDGANGAAGTVFGQLVLRNASGQSCTLFGYPGLQRLDASRHELPTEVTRDPSPAPALVTLAPQQQASVGYAYCDVCSAQTQLAGPCPPAAFVELTPPDEKDFVVVRSAMAPCDRSGTVRVTALRPGKGGAPA